VTITRREFLKRNAKALFVLSLGSITMPLLIKNVYAEGTTLLRPPGAMFETDFLNKCIRCFKCGEACPYGTIKFGGWRAGLALETPYIHDLQKNPCFLCMKCTEVCPTGALKTISSNLKVVLREVKLGTAVISDRRCVVINGMTHRCHHCIIQCPYKDLAIYMDERGYPVVNSEYCVGCGICMQVCPFAPGALWIEPRRES